MKTTHSAIEPLESRIAPATIVVNNLSDSPVSGQVDLRQAIASSHAGDTITFKLPSGSGPSEIFLQSGGNYGELLIDHHLTISGPGSNKLIINASNSSSRIFDIDYTAGTPDAVTSISGLAFIRGDSHGANNDGSGGAIFSAQSFSIKNCNFSFNTAINDGGAIAAVIAPQTGGTVSITGTQFTNNSAKAGVGGAINIAANKSATVTGSVFTANTVPNGAYDGGGACIHLTGTATGATISKDIFTANIATGFGGGLAVSDDNPLTKSKITVSSCNVTGNSALGGGIDVAQGNIVVTGSTISNNTGDQGAGGILGFGFDSLTVASSKVTGNRSTGNNSTGGGIDFYQGSVATVTSCTIIDNTSAYSGGGIDVNNAVALTISKSTISGNTAQKNGGGIYLRGSAALKITGGIIGDNVASYNGGGIADLATGNLTITGSKITGNTAFLGTTGSSADQGGGGLFVSASGLVTLTGLTVQNNNTFGQTSGGGLLITNSSSVTITKGLFSGNFAGQYGGGIYTDESAGTISGATISGNVAKKGGGLYQAAGGLDFTLAKISGNVAISDQNTN